MNELALSNGDRRSMTGAWCVALLSAIVGAAICWMILGGYSGRSAVLESSWFCGQLQSDSYGCRGVFTSRYGRVLGVPLPIFGLLYFLTVIIWLLAFRREAFNVLMILLVTGGAVVSVVLLAILYFVLPGQCRWCLLVHACNVGLIAAACFGARRFCRSSSARSLKAYAPRAIVVVLVVACIAGWSAAAVAQHKATLTGREYLRLRLGTDYQLWLYQSQKPRDMVISKDDHILGPADAPVKIVVYKDFQCEHCSEAWRMVYGLYRDKYAAGGKVALIVRHWPWSKRCNPHVAGDWHPYACQAAWASQAVAMTGGNDAFWKYHQLLVDHHDQLDHSPYAELAEQVGVTRDEFVKQMNSPQTRARVQADVESAERFGVRGVPSFFINGRYFDGWKRKDLMIRLIDEAIADKTRSQ